MVLTLVADIRTHGSATTLLWQILGLYVVVLISSDTYWYSGEWSLHVSLVPVTDLETIVCVTDFLW